jgi:hypothetical protein
MLRNLIVFLVIVVFLLAQGPQAWNTARSWLGLDDWEWWKRDAVTSPERAKELAAKGLREQLISFDGDFQSLEYKYGARPDTQRYDIYAIGVGQLTLNEPEEVEKVVVTGSRLPDPRTLPNADTLPTYPISGQFNNVLIFDRRTGIFTKLFDRRLAVSQFQYGWRTKPEVLIIFATQRDSNKNGKLDDADLQDIYVYTFADKQMHKVDVPNINPSEILDIPDADYVVVKAVHDRDGDGTAGRHRPYDKEEVKPDPTVLLRVDLKTFTASSFVPEDMLRELQATLDGPKPSAARQPPKP